MEISEYHRIINPLFSIIKDKTVLEYGCYIGDWWQMFELHSPKKVTAIDPRRHPDIESNIIKYNHFVDFKQVGYENLEKDVEHDVIVCAGVLYKMSSPFHLIEDIVSRNPEHILFETTGQLNDNDKKYTLDTIGEHQDTTTIIKNLDGAEINFNDNIKRLRWMIIISPNTVVDAFEELGYELETYININCESRPSKSALVGGVVMMKFIRT